MLFLLKLPHIARSERTTKSKSRSNLFYSQLFLTKKQCDHENHNHIQRSMYEGHQYIYWLKSSSFETQVARNNIYNFMLKVFAYPNLWPPLKTPGDISSRSRGLNLVCIFMYSTFVKRPLSKRPKNGFQDQLLLNAGQKYCRMLQGEHSAILSTFIKLPFVIKIFVLSIFEWAFYTGFTVYPYSVYSGRGGSGETANMCRLTLTFAACQCIKY